MFGSTDFVLICFIFSTGVHTTSAISVNFDHGNASNLEAALLTSYYTTVRPSGQTNVEINYGILRLTELDIISETLHVDGFLAVTWTDDRLSFNPASFGGITETYLKPSDIWVPPLVLNNAGSGLSMLSDNSDLDSTPIRVMSTGVVIWLLPTSFSASCSVNVKYYPFDSQTCYILVSSWAYTSGEVMISPVTGLTEISMELYEENGEWSFHSSKVESTTETLLSHPMPVVQFTMELTRKYSYYLLNMVLPVVILALLGVIVFLIPVNGGDQIGYAMTVLLSLSVVLGQVSDSIPKTSEHVSVLSVYLLVTYIISSLEVLVIVEIYMVYTWHEDGFKPSPKVSRIAKNYIAVVTRYQKASDRDEKKCSTEEQVKLPSNKLPPVTFPKNKVRVSMSDEEELANARDVESRAAWSDAGDDGHVTYNYQDIAKMTNELSFMVFLFITFAVTILCLLFLIGNF